MKNHLLTRRARIAAVTVVVAVGLAACSGDDNDASSATTARAPASSTAPSSTTTTTAPDLTALSEANFGPGCAAVPAEGAGSFAAMTAAPAATAAADNPMLSTLVAAVGATGLGATLDGPGPFTIFAPYNAAFAKIDKATLDAFLADPAGRLGPVLTYHVVAGEQLDAAELLERVTVETANGGFLAIGESGDTIEVNGSSAVVCGNVETANAIVHIVDSVLLPK
ncbi:MAG: fasciclin domain-containing protein [Acidimicrobiia bacterium]|nr:fasciclin domain-containing protein [Acidimicrobiia bacterium]